MTKITIGVSEVYKNSDLFRFHRKKTKPSWKHYFLDNESGDWKFDTEWVDSVKAQLLKLKKRYKRYFVCFDCGAIFYAYVKNSRRQVKCPFSPDDEELES